MSTIIPSIISQNLSNFMVHQSEQTLENNLIEQLQDVSYERVIIRDEADMIANLRKQLSLHNRMDFSPKEFDKILNHLNKGNIFERAKILRNKMQLIRDDGSVEWIRFIDMDNWCQNEFQVTNQITVDGTYQNRYDVTLLIN